MGMRLRDFSETIPKPLVPVGPQPILWHLMRYYAHYGHNEFILCLGHGAEKIKQYFLDYDECAYNDFVFTHSGRQIELLRSDIDDWRITFVDTGLTSNIGERLRRVRQYVGDDAMFLANYADGLSDLPLDTYIEEFHQRDVVASFLSVPAPHTFHIVHADDDQYVTALEPVGRSTVRVNAGFFLLRSEIFDTMRPGEELVNEPFQRLMDARQLVAVPYDGFWQNMDTFKDKMELDELYRRGSPPWERWRNEIVGSDDVLVPRAGRFVVSRSGAGSRR
jgi:glucose-1-phosphate cytidylyltransferase